MVSDAYHVALAEAREHHESSKTYSGKFLRPHAPFIKKIIDEEFILSILDYGCGKGKQYEWVSHGDDASIPKGYTIEQYWRQAVKKFDPAWPPFATPPAGKFDLVICTHVIGSIPTVDLPAFVSRLFALANKHLYVAEKLGPVRKQVFSDPAGMPRGFSFEDWATLLGATRTLDGWPGRITLATRERTDAGVHVQRETF